jgi:two-component system, OmpR family, sensor histidine kinase KdpD
MVPPENDRIRRLDPDALLRRVESVERAARGGQLKVFFAYCPGVGQSFRLFDEGRRRKERGEDVVIGAWPPEPSEDLLRVTHGIESIPTTFVDGIPVLDVARLLARRPDVCLVDGLATDNPPGSERAHRYQDVAALLDAGISVLTSINLEYVAEQQSFVRRMMGTAPAQQVPQSFLMQADELVVVDAPPAWDGDPAERWPALRERALLIAAQAADDQLERYLRGHDVAWSWGMQERILVCMTPRANASRMLAAGRRAADQSHGELFAVYVTQAVSTEEDRMANQRNAMLADAQGATLDVIEAQDPVPAILDCARRHRITQLFVGHTRSLGWRARLFGTPLDRLIRAADGIDVRVFPQ